MDEIIKAEAEVKRRGGNPAGAKMPKTVEAKQAAMRVLELVTSPDKQGKSLLDKDLMELSPAERMRITVDCIKILTPKLTTVDIVEKKVSIEVKLMQLASNSLK